MALREVSTSSSLFHFPGTIYCSSSLSFPRVGLSLLELREIGGKLNVDGSVRLQNGLASAGSLIRSAEGSWLSGFTHKLGSCSPFKAKLWGVLDGLRLAWDKGFKHVDLVIDPSEAIKVNIEDVHVIKAPIGRPWNINCAHGLCPLLITKKKAV
ncbi:conserved hypothetical protein [Ricinus communis]|uniref:RNase H type-1 domain-containing protein n=1 Tax=Ricinus communis TaxID=3988 RepID=B9RU26_RICCO|nr:conserved hypothetical protein [Ricinus communis]